MWLNKNCPFCGCEPNGIKSHDPECFLVLWVEDSVSLNVPHKLLHKAWNKRAELTCEGCKYEYLKNEILCHGCVRDKRDNYKPAKVVE